MKHKQIAKLALADKIDKMPVWDTDMEGYTDGATLRPSDREKIKKMMIEITDQIVRKLRQRGVARRKAVS